MVLFSCADSRHIVVALADQDEWPSRLEADERLLCPFDPSGDAGVEQVPLQRDVCCVITGMTTAGYSYCRRPAGRRAVHLNLG